MKNLSKITGYFKSFVVLCCVREVMICQKEDRRATVWSGKELTDGGKDA